MEHVAGLPSSASTRMSLGAFALAVLLHVAAALALWWMTANRPTGPAGRRGDRDHDREAEAARSATPPPPEPKPQPQPQAQPKPQPQPAPPLRGVPPPAEITADKRSQVPPSGDQPKDIAGPPPRSLDDPVPEPQPPTQAAAAEPPKPKEPPPPVEQAVPQPRDRPAPRRRVVAASAEGAVSAACRTEASAAGACRDNGATAAAAAAITADRHASPAAASHAADCAAAGAPTRDGQSRYAALELALRQSGRRPQPRAGERQLHLAERPQAQLLHRRAGSRDTTSRYASSSRATAGCSQPMWPSRAGRLRSTRPFSPAPAGTRPTCLYRPRSAATAQPSSCRSRRSAHGSNGCRRAG